MRDILHFFGGMSALAAILLFREFVLQHKATWVQKDLGESNVR